jgi:hypothetical protein
LIFKPKNITSLKKFNNSTCPIQKGGNRSYFITNK